MSVFLYSYNYSLYTNTETTNLQQNAVLLQEKLSIWLTEKRTLIRKTHLEIDLFYKQFKQENPNQNNSFIVIDNNCHILFQSNNNPAYSKINDCEPGIIDRLKNTQGFLGTSFSLETVTYPYYAKLKKSPYLIFIGYDKALLEQNLHGKIFPKLYSFLLMGILCMIILYFFRRKIVNPISKLSHCATLISKGETNIKIPRQNSIEMFHLAKALLLVKHYIKRNANYRKKLEIANETIQASTKAREDFMQSINKEVTHPLREIMIYSEILLKEIIEHANSAELIHQSVTCIEKIREATANIKSKTSNTLNLSSFKIQDILEQAIQINLKQGLNKKINFQRTFSNTTSFMYGDALKLKQIFVSLLSQSVENSPENQAISISMIDYYVNDQPTVNIVIQDHSFGLSEDELQKIQQKIGWHENNHLFSKIDFNFIEKLVKVHHGTFHCENKLHQGRIITFRFPLLAEKDFATQKSKNNLYYLHQKN